MTSPLETCDINSGHKKLALRRQNKPTKGKVSQAMLRDSGWVNPVKKPGSQQGAMCGGSVPATIKGRDMPLEQPNVQCRQGSWTGTDPSFASLDTSPSLR